jgi:3'(2'), 5'-bisphosphate nucleotidase
MRLSEQCVLLVAMLDSNPQKLIDSVRDIVCEAGREIMIVYADLDPVTVLVEAKSDGSPVTQADHRAHRVIVQRLRELTPDTPILSEESAQAPYAERRRWEAFWLVDPLDGTKEFINRNGEFTVNVALVRDGRPVLGVVGVPAKDTVYWGCGGEAFREAGGGKPRRIHVSHYGSGVPTVVASRSHAGGTTGEFIERVKQALGDCELKSIGSALKICLVAEGEADVYPRLGLTSEWDIAAAHCVLDAAGGRMTDARGGPIQYNKENILNPWFVAMGKSDFDWIGITRDLAEKHEA